MVPRKVTPGVASAGGVILSLGGHTRLTFSWSLGTKTNNEVEAYALFKGLLLAQNQGMDSISISGDSKAIISHVRKKTLWTYMKLRNIFTRIFKESKSIHSFFPSMFYITTTPTLISKLIRMSETK
jgi:ribonuclease HI